MLGGGMINNNVISRYFYCKKGEIENMLDNSI